MLLNGMTKKAPPMVQLIVGDLRVSHDYEAIHSFFVLIVQPLGIHGLEFRVKGTVASTSNRRCKLHCSQANLLY